MCGRARGVSLLQRVQNDCRYLAASNSMDIEILFSGLKQPRLETDHSLQIWSIERMSGLQMYTQLRFDGERSVTILVSCVAHFTI